MNNEKNKAEFLNLLRSTNRDGIENLIEWLESTDFFTAPASTKYHGAYPGGLLQHSINVSNRLHDEVFRYGQYAKYYDSKILVSLLHDVCKANMYVESSRNVKDPVTGTWSQVPCYTVDEQYPFGHGEKSVYLISKHIRLTDEEAMAIRWHMGGFDQSVKGGSYSVGYAFEKYPLALLLHIADMKATYLDEERG